KRDIVEHGKNIVLLHMVNKTSALLQILQFNILHVRIVLTAFRNDRPGKVTPSFKILKLGVIPLPNGHSFAANIIRSFQLRPLVRRIQLAGK
ncbi:hypothetical protein, partial [Pseudomonas aeruginosa]|uniref:hypothetical protein n=1 Tax=Pseudomonas aeruginosa TaxID=287 RepID=UPI001F4B3DFE